MANRPWAYLHLLALRCEQCAQPVAISVTREEANLKMLTANLFMFNASAGG
jgi:hypothetical protein